jgi:hydroxymethylpyrimidine pyrophosphatase-like HAD family hydrolase
MSKQKTIAFDLDDVICYRRKEYENLGPLKYDYCESDPDTVKFINELYEEGHKIIIYTARGMTQFKGNVALIYSELYSKTIEQLNGWGLKYDQLVMGKIHYDVLVDDKVMNSSDLTKDGIKKFL